MKTEDLIKLFSYDDIYTMYIVENTPQKDAPSLLNITYKDFRRLLTFYGIRKDPKMARKNNKYERSHEEYVRLGKKSAETQKRNWANKSDEEKEEWAKYCSEVQLNLPKEKRDSMTSKMLETNSKKTQEELDLENKKRSMSCKEVWARPETHEKYKITFSTNRKARGESIFRSKDEELIFNKLKKLYSDIIYEYIDERYPFSCDFYIPSLDLFIEYQGHPSHGIRPYAEGNKERIIDSWYNTYAVRDVEKYNIAIKNKLNYIRIYPSISLEENYTINSMCYMDLVKYIYFFRN